MRQASRYLVSTLFLLVLPVDWHGGWAASSLSNRQVEELVRHIEARYAQLQDLQAVFNQETRIEGFETPLTSTGRVYMKKPAFLRWDYLEPSEEYIYVHGDQVEMYTPAHEQILRGSLTSMVSSKAPLQLLQGASRLTDHFEIHPAQDSRGESGLPRLVLIPRDREHSPVVRIVSEVDPKTYLLKTVTLYEKNGNRSTFRFSQIQTNRGLDDRLFRLIPPEGVVIIEDAIPH
ncbi:MAG: outer membrane lipoprotein carrier protein LolA [Nitrospirae bacterium]|nr:MAG: outer membrane lipoprotein carrier protein LolA [Nitrospirota bacterium]